jgi:DNA polymerase-3 subunit gamma/tau
MSYQVIARKWRPQTFAEVTGQEPITRTLRNAIEHERLHHAYLFSGARGVGKTTTARLLAKALNCHKSQKPTATPCRTDDPQACPSCREITESRSIDVQEIDAASHTQVDNVRETIIASIGFAPARDRFKIFIIDEVHMLSTHSFNALLKTIEEPPDRVVFIMATTEKHKVPDTILSRSQQFEFRTIAAPKIFERLKEIATAEEIKVDEQALREIARAGEGSMRDAQSAFDQVISFAGAKINKEDVELALGVAGADILTRIVNGIAENNAAEAISVIDEVVMRGHDLRNFCRDVLAHLRDLLVTKVTGSEELLESAVCDAAELKRQAALFSESDLVRFFHSLADTETKLSKAAHPRYQLEIGLVKLMEMRRLEPLTQLLERLTALEKVVGAANELPQSKSRSPTSSNPPSRTVKRAPTETTRGQRAASNSFTGTAAKQALENSPTAELRVPTTPDLAGSEPIREVPTVGFGTEIDRIKSALEAKRKMLLVTVLEAASSITLAENELCIEFAPEARHFRDTLAKGDNAKVLRDACQEVTNRQVGVRIIIQDRDANETPPSKEDNERREKQLLIESAEKHPVVRQMLRTFRGEIVDVRRVEPEQ